MLKNSSILEKKIYNNHKNLPKKGGKKVCINCHMNNLCVSQGEVHPCIIQDFPMVGYIIVKPNLQLIKVTNNQ